jgi:DNA helicase HerA-like ATPase
VFLLTTEETKQALNIDGDLRLGRAVGYPEIHVALRSSEKHHIPRHTLVVGTTGSGKSTCIAGLIEKLAAAGFCVLVIDVEGEYTAINRPADSDKIVPALMEMGVKPGGLNRLPLLELSGALFRLHARSRRELGPGRPVRPAADQTRLFIVSGPLHGSMNLAASVG